MALKKQQMENFFRSNQTDQNKDITQTNRDIPKYSHNKVFEEPDSLKIITKKSENKLQQNYNKTTTKLQQNYNKTTTNVQQNYNKTTTNVQQKLQQNYNKVDSFDINSSVAGFEATLLWFVFEKCINNDSNITTPLFADQLVTALEKPIKIIKTSAYRLEKKGLLIKQAYRSGRGGWTKYELPDKIYQAMASQLGRINFAPNYNKTTTKLQQKLQQASLTSSSSINTTTGEESSSAKPTWQIDFHALEEIGFSQDHIEQLQQANCTSLEKLQNSIKHFAFDLAHNDRRASIKGSPISFFMGIMRKFGVYNAPDNYKDPDELVIEQYLEQQEKQQREQAALEKRWFELEKQKWLDTLSEESKNALLPDDVRAGRLNGPKQACLSEHFKQTIWPDISQNKPWLEEAS